MSFTEGIAAARAFAGAGEPRPQPNRELLAVGLANVAGGLFGAMPAGAAPRRPRSTGKPAPEPRWPAW